MCAHLSCCSLESGDALPAGDAAAGGEAEHVVSGHVWRRAARLRAAVTAMRRGLPAAGPESAGFPDEAGDARDRGTATRPFGTARRGCIAWRDAMDPCTTKRCTFCPTSRTPAVSACQINTRYMISLSAVSCARFPREVSKEVGAPGWRGG